VKKYLISSIGVAAAVLVLVGVANSPGASSSTPPPTVDPKAIPNEVTPEVREYLEITASGQRPVRIPISDGDKTIGYELTDEVTPPTARPLDAPLPAPREGEPGFRVYSYADDSAIGFDVPNAGFLTVDEGRDYTKNPDSHPPSLTPIPGRDRRR